MHPADLDGALQLSGLLLPSSGELRLPFTLAEASLLGAKGRMWSVVQRLAGGEKMGVFLASKSSTDPPLAKLDGFESRLLKLDAQPAAVRPSHMYVIGWEGLKPAEPASAVSALVLGAKQAFTAGPMAVAGSAAAAAKASGIAFSLPLAMAGAAEALPVLEGALFLVQQQLV